MKTLKKVKHDTKRQFDIRLEALHVTSEPNEIVTFCVMLNGCDISHILSKDDLVSFKNEFLQAMKDGDK